VEDGEKRVVVVVVVVVEVVEAQDPPVVEVVGPPAGGIPEVYRDRRTAPLPEALHQDLQVTQIPGIGGADLRCHTTGTESPTKMLVIFLRVKEFV